MPPPSPRGGNRCRALLIIDNRPLQAAAWAELLQARRRLEKATCDVHRHEEVDEPALRAWIATIFPQLLSAAREAAQQLATKIKLVQEIENEAFITGQHPGRIWRQWQQSGGRPPEPPPGRENGRERAAGPASPPDFEAAFEEEMKRLFEEEGVDANDPFAEAFRGATREIFGLGGGPSTPPATADARAIYRRLVQHLHPDRGGEWTPPRARLWEQVQEAWAARDGDWLARLEVEWEARTDLLGPTSAVGRLRAALVEIDAARRDAEKRVREYRKQQAWRFSLKPPSLAFRANAERQLRHDAAMLRAQLENIESTLAQWSKRPARNYARRRRRGVPQWDFEF